MKNAFDMAGDYHKFILNRHFNHDISVYFLIGYFAAIKLSDIDIFLYSSSLIYQQISFKKMLFQP